MNATTLQELNVEVRGIRHLSVHNLKKKRETNRMKWVRVSLCVISLWQTFLCATDCTEKFPPFGFTFEFHLFGGANKVTRKKKTLSGSKGKGRVTTPLRPSGVGRAASVPPNGGRGADPNAPTTAKNRVKTPHDVTAPKKTGAQFQRQMMSIGMCRRRHHDVNQEPLRSKLCKPPQL